MMSRTQELTEALTSHLDGWDTSQDTWHNPDSDVTVRLLQRSELSIECGHETVATIHTSHLDAEVLAFVVGELTETL